MNSITYPAGYGLVLGDAGPPLPVTLLANGAAFVLDADTDTVVLNYLGPDKVTRTVSMAITDAALGQVQREWSAGDLPVPGAFSGQIVVTRTGDEEFPQTFPDDGNKLYVVISPSLAAGLPAPPTTDYVNDDASPIVIGQPVYQTSAGHVDLAVGSDVTHATVIGLVAANSIAASASGAVQSTGSIVASFAQWSAVVTGAPSDGLTQGAAYYADPTVPGMLTTTPPTSGGKYATLVGIAANANQFDLSIQAPFGPLT